MLFSSRTVLSLLVVVFSCSPAAADLVLNDLSDYTNNFDFLKTADKLNAWNNDQATQTESGSPGWYWQKGTASLTYEAGNAMSPGAFSLGTSNDRAMGSYTGSGNLNIAWGIVFQNNSGQTISQIDVSYNGEQWRRADTTVDRLQFSFATSAAAINDLVPTGGPSPAGWTPEASLSFAAPLAPGTPAFFDPISPTPVSSTIAVNVPNGQFLALRWYDGDVAGNDAALGIDDLTVSFTATAVPEPSALLFGGLVAGVLAVAAEIRKRRVVYRVTNG